MRLVFTICFLFIVHLSQAQGNTMNFAYIDARVRHIDAPTPDSLASLLTASYTNDLQKARSIFRWITEHIAYQTRMPYFKNRRPGKKDGAADEEDTSLVLKPLSERVAEQVLQKRMAVCDGYARLFKTLCDYAGLRSEIITGYARVDRNRTSSLFRANHTWNAVFVDSSWHLLDATWAAGFISMHGGEFVRHFDESYFLTPPEIFIQDHYPEDHLWTLLPAPPLMREYLHTPFKHGAFVKHRIASFRPAKGILEATVGDTLHFELEITDEAKRLVVADHPYADLLPLEPGGRNGTVTGNKVSCSYHVSSDSVQWLHVIYGNEVVMRYQLKVRKENTLPQQPAVGMVP